MCTVTLQSPNGVVVLDFAGATTETAGTVKPVVFTVIGVVAFAATVGHRWLAT